MKNASIALMVFSCSMLGTLAGTAHAHTLLFDPIVQTATQGQTVSVKVRMQDAQPSGVGAYSLDVIFDPTILAFDHALDGFGLGNALGLAASSGAGAVTLVDGSFDLPADLLAVQPNDFLLFELFFGTIGPGTSTLSFQSVTVADANGLPETPTLNTGSITVNRALPEPGTLPLLGIVLTLLGVSRWWSGRIAVHRRSQAA